MPVPTQVPFPNTAQYPANLAGPLGEHGFFAPAAFQVGTGGMPGVGRITASGGTVTGIVCQVGPPGFAATLIGTGLYSITAPAAAWGTIDPTVSTPSGVALGVQPVYHRGNSVTGTYQIRTYNPANSALAMNAPTGTTFDLNFFVSPVSTVTRF